MMLDAIISWFPGNWDAVLGTMVTGISFEDDEPCAVDLMGDSSITPPIRDPSWLPGICVDMAMAVLAVCISSDA